MMTDDLTLYRFALFLLGAFTLMLIMTRAFEHSPEKRTSDPNFWLILFTAVLAVATVALVIVAIKQTEVLSSTNVALKQAAGAADAANKLNASVQRPWLHGTATIAGDLVFESDAYTGIKLDFPIENSGHSPALDVIALAELYPDMAAEGWYDATDSIDKRLADTCGEHIFVTEVAQKIRPKYASGNAIFPGTNNIKSGNCDKYL